MKKRFNILKRSYLWIMISLFLGAISLFLFLFNAKYSEEFTGGVNISFVTTQNEETIQTNLENFLTNQGYTNFQTSINTQGEETQIKVNTSLESDDQVAQLSSEIQSFLLSNAVVSSTSDIIGQAIIGPSVGSYMKTSAFQALIIGILLMVVYMLIAFKEIRKFISPSILATVVVTVIILNVLVTVGAYGAWMMFNPTIQVDTVFIIAILTVIAYGINDVIIIFDRIRENMMKLTKEKTIVYGKVIEESLRQTMRRSIGTSLSTLLVLIAMLIFGTGVLQNFAFTVAIGVIVTTFSSIFLGGSLAYLLMGKYNKEKEKIS